MLRYAAAQSRCATSRGQTWRRRIGGRPHRLTPLGWIGIVLAGIGGAAAAATDRWMVTTPSSAAPRRRDSPQNRTGLRTHAPTPHPAAILHPTRGPPGARASARLVARRAPA